MMRGSGTCWWVATDPAAQREALHMLIGREIGYGQGRAVYECTILPDCVVKVELRGQSFQNVLEWRTWEIAGPFKAMAQWLAPCVHISPSGHVLIQKRTTPAERSAYPERIPAFFADRKRSNWGLLDGRFVCHDYGTTVFREMSPRLARANWTD